MLHISKPNKCVDLHLRRPIRNVDPAELHTVFLFLSKYIDAEGAPVTD